jgi:uncharacterized protein YjiS (DUF1127 family)
MNRAPQNKRFVPNHSGVSESTLREMEAGHPDPARRSSSIITVVSNQYVKIRGVWVLGRISNLLRFSYRNLQETAILRNKVNNDKIFFLEIQRTKEHVSGRETKWK